MEMPFTKEFLEIGWKWLNANASDKVGLCSDRSCIRCRLAGILFELESRTNGNAQQQVQGDNGYICKRPAQCAKGMGGKCFSGSDCSDKAIAP